MKVLATILLLASLALNAAFLTGCVTRGTFFGDGQTSANDDGRARLVRIADLLDIPTEGKSAFDLESDIRHALDRAMIAPPAFDEATFEKTAKKVNSKEEEVLRDCQRFILRLQGKRVIAVGGDD